jgi:hypothetical protein
MSDDDSEKFRRFAGECLRLAERFQSVDDRTVLLSFKANLAAAARRPRRLGKPIGVPFALQRVAMRRRGKEAATYRRDLRPTVPVPGTWRRHVCIRRASFAPPLTQATKVCAAQTPSRGESVREIRQLKGSAMAGNSSYISC